METIKNYLESMFMNLPLTAEVIKAKKELLQMMQDKYQELINEGKRENEAVSIVISEFGDLKEIADDLGIGECVNPDVTITKKQIPQEEAFSYIRDRAGAAFRIAFGIALFIISPVGFIIEEETTYLPFSHNSIFGIIFLFVAVALGVGLLVYTGSNNSSKWNGLFDGQSAITMATAEEIEKEKFSITNVKNLYTTLGIITIILSLGATAIVDEFSNSDIAGAVFLCFVALGVAFIVFANVKHAAYDNLLKLSGNTHYINEEKKRDKEMEYSGSNKWIKLLLSTYWSTVVCLYLIVSFITGAWHITWLIWVLAPLVKNLIITIASDK